MNEQLNGPNELAPPETHLGREIEAFYDGELDERDGARVARHLSECPSCRAALARRHALSALVAAVGTAPTRRSDAEFWARLAPRLGAQLAPRRAWQSGPGVGAPLGAPLGAGPDRRFELRPEPGRDPWPGPNRGHRARRTPLGRFWATALVAGLVVVQAAAIVLAAWAASTWLGALQPSVGDAVTRTAASLAGWCPALGPGAAVLAAAVPEPLLALIVVRAALLLVPAALAAGMLAVASRPRATVLAHARQVV